MSLKTKNMPFIVGTVLLLYVAFALVNGLDWSFAESADISADGFQLDNPLLTFVFHFVALVASYLLPSDWKHRLIYLRWQHPLPGSRAFTELCDKDARISRDDLEVKYGELPTSAAEQNALWYRIYRSKESDTVVANSHGRWLFFRDVFSVCLVLTLPAVGYTFVQSGVGPGVVLTLSYLLGLLALWICARNTGIRFTCNVLAR